MKLYRFEDASQFYDRVKDYLVNHEALHNVMLGLCNALIDNPERFDEKPYLADVEIDEDIVAVAMRIPPKALMLSQVKDLRAVEAIALKSFTLPKSYCLELTPLQLVQRLLLRYGIL